MAKGSLVTRPTSGRLEHAARVSKTSNSIACASFVRAEASSSGARRCLAWARFLTGTRIMTDPRRGLCSRQGAIVRCAPAPLFHLLYALECWQHELRVPSAEVVWRLEHREYRRQESSGNPDMPGLRLRLIRAVLSRPSKFRPGRRRLRQQQSD